MADEDKHVEEARATWKFKLSIHFFLYFSAAKKQDQK